MTVLPDPSSGPFDSIVIMGVCACGKSTVGQRLADRLGLRFIDGDDLHSPTCIARMQAGIGLSDSDRIPWLTRVAAALASGERDAGIVVACSALKRSYRDRLRALAPGVWFVYLRITEDVASARAAGRSAHFAPVALVRSQFEALEEPDGMERDTITIDGTDNIDAIVKSVLDKLT